MCNAQRRTLCAQVLLADEATGNLSATLRRHGLWDDTILVMSNDVRSPSLFVRLRGERLEPFSKTALLKPTGNAEPGLHFVTLRFA